MDGPRRVNASFLASFSLRCFLAPHPKGEGTDDSLGSPSILTDPPPAFPSLFLPIHSIQQVLELLQVDRYEVPFLWAYRRDHFAQQIPTRDVRARVRAWVLLCFACSMMDARFKGGKKGEDGDRPMV